MLASDVDALDEMIADDLLFVGPTGAILSKHDDLKLHQSGAQRMTAIDVQERKMVANERLASVSVVASVSGVFLGNSFQGNFHYLRVWSLTSHGWRVVAGSVSLITNQIADSGAA